MHALAQNPGNPRRIAAHVLTGIVAVFLLLDGVMKLVQPQVVITPLRCNWAIHWPPSRESVSP